MEFFKGGKFHGAYASYYRNGQLKEKGFFKEDKRDGEYESYYQDGKIRERALYKDGKLVGKFLAYDPQGNLLDKNHMSEDLPPEAEDIEEIREKKQSIDELLSKLAHFDKEE